jgi:hypothetical protein
LRTVVFIQACFAWYNHPKRYKGGPKKMWHFYWAWFTLAFKGAWAIASSIAGGAAIIMGIIVWRVPKWEAPLKNLYWIIPLGIFLILLLIRLTTAPYDIYKEQQQTIAQLNRDLEASRQKESVSEIEVTARDLTNDIAQFIAERSLGSPKNPTTTDQQSIDQWMQAQRQYYDQTNYLFVVKYRQRIIDLGYRLLEMHFITEEEQRNLNWFAQAQYPSMEWALEALEKYCSRLR